MKLHSVSTFRLLACCLAALVALAGGAPATPAKTDPSAATTNAAPAELVVPQSVFNLTTLPFKDPFFPLSMRQPSSSSLTSTNAPKATDVSSFQLKGLSGQLNQRLALINNRTLAVGETAEVTTVAGKAKIRCLAIKESSVVIRIEDQPEPVELRLPTDRELMLAHPKDF